jgi:hypothetical protein
MPDYLLFLRISVAQIQSRIQHACTQILTVDMRWNCKKKNCNFVHGDYLLRCLQEGRHPAGNEEECLGVCHWRIDHFIEAGIEH